MKYIVFKCSIGDDVREFPVIFPQHLVHKHVSDSMIELIKKSGWKEVNPISAGECNFFEDEINCGGESTTLNLQSRRDIDDHLIRMFNYKHGII